MRIYVHVRGDEAATMTSGIRESESFLVPMQLHILSERVEDSPIMYKYCLD